MASLQAQGLSGKQRERIIEKIAKKMARENGHLWEKAREDKMQDLDLLGGVKKKFSLLMKKLQDEVTWELKKIDPKLEVTEDIWSRQDYVGKDGGGGRTRAFEGPVIENAGVNTSEVFGQIEPSFARKIGSTDESMWAAGLSLIIHPRNPHIPTVHANFRMICAGEKFWFGGGADLTPFYPHVDDFIYFHQTWEKSCGPYGVYDEWKKNCDEYFVNKHRGHEMRGIGGIFYDHYYSGDLLKDFAMVVDISNHFIPSYFPIVLKRKKSSWDEADEEFQLHRHGRYVEFNLLHDRGTHFGLQSNGRTDSILISLPKRCHFTYKYHPVPGSPHEEMLAYYYPKKWV